MRTVIAQFTVLPDKAPEAEAAMKKLAAAVQAHRESSHLAEFVALFNAGTVFDAASTSIERYQRFAGVQR
jgi:quinol monooxygenase YgiN